MKTGLQTAPPPQGLRGSERRRPVAGCRSVLRRGALAACAWTLIAAPGLLGAQTAAPPSPLKGSGTTAGAAGAARPSGSVSAVGAVGSVGSVGAVSAVGAVGAMGTAGISGISQAIKEVRLSMPVAGRIEGLMVREGSFVQAGDVLLHLDRTIEELEVRRRKLLLEDRSRLEELRQRERTLSEQVAGLRELEKLGGASRKQLEDETLTLNAVAAERGALEEAKRREAVELELAQETYERRHLRSPISGVVTRIALREGESVVPHEPVVWVVDVRRVRFMGTVPAAEGQALRSGMTVRVEFGSAPSPLVRPARLVFVSPVADPSSGLVEVIAEIDNRDGSLRPGLSGRLKY